MAFRFRMVPDVTHIDFFKPMRMRFWLAISIIGMVGSIVLHRRSAASTTASTSAAAPS